MTTMPPADDPTSQLQQCQQELANVTEQLQALNSAKSDFLNMAAHQLRTPVTTAKWYVEILLSGRFGEVNDKQKQALEQIEQSSTKIAELITTLISISQLQLGQRAIQTQELSLKQSIQQVIQDVDEQASKQHITIESDLTTDGSITTDQELVAVALRAIIANAISYSHDGASVQVQLKKHLVGEQLGVRTLMQDSLVVAVTDQGMGIPAEQQSKIYSRLFRASNAMESPVKGTGLGLYLTKLITQRLGMHTWFTSQQDTGTTFYISFPTKLFEKKA